ncbi:hypothetical protein [Shewanella chilikensis]|uniref:hypothetical protein n=1 Tax=Shewanella chilikensis TaxID=558541 RepID=UPI001F193B91|nr:hypothetical protein [Shewanella chilikensis]MCE9788045.1 hypothetical protein [Shewanella chilikensis]
MMFSSSTRLGRLTLFCQAGLQLHVNDGDKLVNIFSELMYFDEELAGERDEIGECAQVSQKLSFCNLGCQILVRLVSQTLTILVPD